MNCESLTLTNMQLLIIYLYASQTLKAEQKYKSEVNEAKILKPNHLTNNCSYPLLWLLYQMGKVCEINAHLPALVCNSIPSNRLANWVVGR